MHQIKWALFYDNHTMTACPDVGKNFNVDEFVGRIKKCGVDYLTFHARCNQGNAYYNTKIGKRHPSLKHDLFGALAHKCKAENIALTAYFNAGLSSQEGIDHPEWVMVSPDGSVYNKWNSSTLMNPFVRCMCYNTPYGEHLIAMAMEVLENYPVDGFFFDCMGTRACICPACIQEMQQKGIDTTDEQAVRKFAEFSKVRFAEKSSGKLKAVNPELLLYYNGVEPELQIDSGTYLEVEALPTGGWAYDYMPVCARYIRNSGKQCVNMTGRFHASWGDFGGIRTEESLKFDCLYGWALGLPPNIGGHFHPRGDINNAVFDLIEKIYKDIQVYEPWFVDAKACADTAIVVKDKAEALSPVSKGAARMLHELKREFDIVSLLNDWDKYELLILPDDVMLTGEIAERIEKHLAKGGRIISSGKSGMDAPDGNFVFSEWGLKYQKDNDLDPAYFEIQSPEMTANMPQMITALYSSGIEAQALEGTEVAATLTASYYNQHWDGMDAYFYTPPAKSTDIPMLTLTSQVAHFSHRIFESYDRNAAVFHRNLLANVLERIMPDPNLKVKNMPSFGRATLMRQESGRRIVHLLSYVPEKRGEKIEMIEEPIVVKNAEVAVKTGAEKVSKVYLAPDKKSLDFTVDNGYVNIKIPEFAGYAMAVIE